MKTFCVEIRRARPLLGTIVEISIQSRVPQIAHEAIEKAFKAIARTQRLMSFHDSQSDLSRLNQKAFRRPVKVNAWTCLVIKKAKQIHRQTNGLFNCAVGSHLIRLRYLPKNNLKLGSSSSVKSLQSVHLLANRKIRFSEHLLLDLGGIAKGFAVDQAVKVLKKAGISNGCVNAGGDLFIFGKKKKPVYIRSPENPGKFILIGMFSDCAVASSGIYFSEKKFLGKKVSAVISSAGRSELSSMSATVSAPSCMVADALTKPLLLEKNIHADYLRKQKASAWLLGKRE